MRRVRLSRSANICNVHSRCVVAMISALAAVVAVSCGAPVESSGATFDAVTSAAASGDPVATPSPATTTTDPPVTSPVTLAIDDTTTTALPSDGSADDTLPPPVPATEHQLAVLAAALSMPGRPDLHDVPYGQEVRVDNRVLDVNVPIFGSWQYNDLDAQSTPGATAEVSETATRDLLAALGIDTTGLTATFTPRGDGIDVGLAGCIVGFANDGRIAFAYGLLKDIPLTAA